MGQYREAIAGSKRRPGVVGARAADRQNNASGGKHLEMGLYLLRMVAQRGFCFPCKQVCGEIAHIFGGNKTANSIQKLILFPVQFGIVASGGNLMHLDNRAVDLNEGLTRADAHSFLQGDITDLCFLLQFFLIGFSPVGSELT